MYIKRNINFFVERRKKAGVLVVDNVPIRMRILYNGWRIEFTTGFRIDANKWEADKQRVKNGCTNKLKQSSSQINAALLDEASIIQQIFQEYEVKGVMPTQEQIKEEFNKRMSTEDVQTLAEETEPEEVVRKWTGHSSYQAMKPYIVIADSIKADAMSKFNQL